MTPTAKYGKRLVKIWCALIKRKKFTPMKAIVSENRTQKCDKTQH